MYIKWSFKHPRAILNIYLLFYSSMKIFQKLFFRENK